MDEAEARRARHRSREAAKADRQRQRRAAAHEHDQRRTQEAALDQRCCGIDDQGRRCEKTGTQVHECTSWKTDRNEPCRCWSCRDCGWAWRAEDEESGLHLQDMMTCACCLAEGAAATDQDPALDHFLRLLSERLGGLPPDLQRALERGAQGWRRPGDGAGR